MKGAAEKFRPSPGRPRSREADEAILAVALELLGKLGYHGITMEAVAKEAGVGKSTVYRRFEGKADLVSAALACLTDPGEELDTGDTRADLKAVLSGFHQRAGSSIGAPVLAALIVEEKNNPELLSLFRRRVILPRRRRLKSILRRGVEKGVIDTRTSLDEAVDILTSAWFSRYLSGGKITAQWTERVIDTVWRGIGSKNPDN